MKLELIVDLEDFWVNENEPLDENILRAVTSTVIAKIQDIWSAKITEEYHSELRRVITDKKDDYITAVINTLASQPAVKRSSYHGGEMVSIEEYIKEVFDDSCNAKSSFASKVQTIIDDKVKVIIIELQKRYDIAFAAKLITKLNDNGMLKEDVAKLLLESEGAKQ